MVDDDLGRSGASIEGRLGFQRLVAEVGLGRVGLGPWGRDVAACALVPGLAPIVGDLRPIRYIDCGCRWRLRSIEFQR